MLEIYAKSTKPAGSSHPAEREEGVHLEFEYI
jgi:hypothetical protein